MLLNAQLQGGDQCFGYNIFIAITIDDQVVDLVIDGAVGFEDNIPLGVILMF